MGVCSPPHLTLPTCKSMMSTLASQLSLPAEDLGPSPGERGLGMGACLSPLSLGRPGPRQTEVLTGDAATPASPVPAVPQLDLHFSWSSLSWLANSSSPSRLCSEFTFPMRSALTATDMPPLTPGSKPLLLCLLLLRPHVPTVK